MITRYLLLVMLIALFCSPLHAIESTGWSLEYGKDNGKLSVYNASTDKDFAEDAPYGPMAFRVLNNTLWVIDSIGARIYSFNDASELNTSLSIKGLPANLLIEDFALVLGGGGRAEAVWLAEASQAQVYKFSLANGSELVKIGGLGNEPGKFVQIGQLEVDRVGRLYVGDLGRSVISVFTPYGELIREHEWDCSGFSVSPEGRLYTIEYREDGGYFYLAYSPAGQLEQTSHIGLAQLEFSKLWAVNDRHLLMSFVPEGGFKGKMQLCLIDRAGFVIKQTDFVPPGSMNRFVSPSQDKIWLAEADFHLAPAGKFKVKTIGWDK